MRAAGLRTKVRFAALGAVLFGATLLVGDAEAHHVVWLDFDDLDLSAWTTVNGNTPPTDLDLRQVRSAVITNIARDYAQFDIRFTTFQPVEGNYTRVAFHKVANGGLFGCAGPECCLDGNCTGLGTWTDEQSGCEVYAGTFAGDVAFLDANATTQRIANGISHTASHELGHVLGMSHCYSADDFVDSGAQCKDGFNASTLDRNVNEHIMASGTSTGLTMEERATEDRFFSVHSARRLLARELQERGAYSSLADVSGDGLGDLPYACLASENKVRWYRRLSTGIHFGKFKQWSVAAGHANDIFLTGDVDGDGRADLVYGHPTSATVVNWSVRLSGSSTVLGDEMPWRFDAGDVGDVFRLGDIDGDGRADLVAGHDHGGGSGAREWVVYPSTGTSFDSARLLSASFGAAGAQYFLVDMDHMGRADLTWMTFGGSPVFTTLNSRPDFTVTAPDVRQANLTIYPTQILLGDVDGDGCPDVVASRVVSSDDVDWYVARSTVGCLGWNNATTWETTAGEAGDLARLADGDGDGLVDLFLGRAEGRADLPAGVNLDTERWLGFFSSSSSFASPIEWAPDAGAEGWIVP